MMMRHILRAIAFGVVLWFCCVAPSMAAINGSASSFERARGLIQAGDCAGALAPLTEEVRAHPQHAIAFKLRGYCHQKLGHGDEAIADYARVIELDPQSADAYVDRGLAYGFRGEYDLAIADYNRALAIAPDNPRAWNARGVADCRQGRSEDGRLDFERAAALSRRAGDRELYRTARRASRELCGRRLE